MTDPSDPPAPSPFAIAGQPVDGDNNDVATVKPLSPPKSPGFASRWGQTAGGVAVFMLVLLLFAPYFGWPHLRLHFDSLNALLGTIIAFLAGIQLSLDSAGKSMRKLTWRETYNQILGVAGLGIGITSLISAML